METIGEKLQTPKTRKSKKVEDPQATPHPIITRHLSQKSLKSNISEWTEDEEQFDSKSPLHDAPFDLSEDAGDEEITTSAASLAKTENTMMTTETTTRSNKSPQLSQATHDSAYGSRGDVMSPQAYNQMIPKFGATKNCYPGPPGQSGGQLMQNGQIMTQQFREMNLPNISSKQMERYVFDQHKRQILSVTATMTQLHEDNSAKIA